MELRHLQYFLAVAETGNVTKAARQFFVAQSALSAQIARLEAETGSRLFVRTRQGMHLTEAGSTLRPLAVQILADVEHAQAQMDSLRGLMRGRLRLGMVQVPPASLDVIGLVASFHRQHPDVELDLRTGASIDLALAVADGELDLALVGITKPDLPGSLDVRQLCDDPLVAVVSTSVRLDKETVAVAELVELGPFIHYRAGSGLRRAVTAAFDRAGISVAARFQLDQVSDMIRLAALGIGVTIVPAGALSSAHYAPGAELPYQCLGLSDPEALHTISAVTLGPPLPAAARFVSLLDGQSHPS